MFLKFIKTLATHLRVEPSIAEGKALPAEDNPLTSQHDVNPLVRGEEYYRAMGASHKSLVFDLIKQIHDEEKFASQLFHLKQLADDDYRYSYNYSVTRIVENELSKLKRVSPSTVKVLDFGCWSGATTRYLSSVLGVQCVGAEIDKTCLKFANQFLVDDLVSFAVVEEDGIQIDEGSMDVVLANAVFANMYLPNHGFMLGELARVVADDGVLILIDSNNPSSAQVKTYLTDLYEQLEGDAGSYMTARAKYINSIHPKADGNIQDAKATCYMTEDQIAEYLAGKREAQYFEPGTLSVPVSLSQPRGAPSTPTDWKYYSEILIQKGFDVVCSPSYPAVSAMNEEGCFILIAKRS